MSMAEQNPATNPPQAHCQSQTYQRTTPAQLTRRFQFRLQLPKRRSYKRWIFLATFRCSGRCWLLFLWHYLSGFESTDDAQVDVHLYPVSARISGYIQKVHVEDNQWVEEGSTLVEIDPKDYEVALARAQATLEHLRGLRERFEHRCARIFRRYLEPIEVHLLGY